MAFVRVRCTALWDCNHPDQRVAEPKLRRRKLHPDRCPALQLLSRPEMARLDKNGNGPGPDAILKESAEAENTCLHAARRPGVTLAIQPCGGNNRSDWCDEGRYDVIAERLFSTLTVDHFLLEL